MKGTVYSVNPGDTHINHYALRS